MNFDNRLVIIYGVTCVAIIYLYYNHTKKVEKELSDIQTEVGKNLKEYEEIVAKKASEQ